MIIGQAMLAASKVVFCSCVLLLLAACYHPITIVGEGDVTSVSGFRDCSLEDYQSAMPNCTENLVDGTYNETYTGIPRAGYQFRRWGNYCTRELTNECRFNVPAGLVARFAGITTPPLQAVFRSTTNTGFTSLFVGDEFFQPLAEGIETLAIEAGFTDHHSNVFFGPGDLGAPQAFWDNAGQRAAIQAVLDTGDIELFGMTYSPAHPLISGYSSWVNYALQKNPDTRFFIALPWNTEPGSMTSTQYETTYQSSRIQVIHALIDALREKYPGVDFYTVPDGQSAVELYKLFNAGNLPDVTGLVGSAADSIFSDSTGNPGNILLNLAQLVWLGAIYDIDITTYGTDPGYTTDLRAVAQSILENHEPEYRAPDEVDVDTDGDGIWDRLDPNPTGKPNILLIMADDLGFNDLAINNDNSAINTPNMDQIARDGVRFTRHYASPVCSPARAALLSGMYPERVGYLPAGRGISPQVVTFPERLQQEGYTTWHIGKWHTGDVERTAWPDYQGFDHWFGFLNQWRMGGAMSGGEIVLAAPRYENPYLQGDTEPGQIFPGHLETILTEKTIEVLTGLQEAGAPWFLNLWYFAPHGPVSPASEFATLYPDTAEGKYQALVHQLDYNIGEVMMHLQTIGALQDTIVVVVSDNGGTNAALDNNAPYSGKKTTVTEGGLRTPLLIQWPDQVLNGQVISDTISIQDLYPTLIEAIGSTSPGNLDGVSHFAAIEGQESAPQRELFWEFAATSYGSLSADGQWRLYQPPPYWGVTLATRLYDLIMDPSAYQWVLPPPPQELTFMLGQYEDWYRDVHTVQTSYTPEGNGGGVLTGMDFLRTPGFGGYTFGIGVPDELDGQIAQQTGIWNISRAGNTISAQFGSLILAGDIVNSNSCHNVVVTGIFHRPASHNSGPHTMSLTLYIDEIEAQSAEIEGVLAVADTAIDTVVGDPLVSSGNGTIVPPVILNVELNDNTTWTLNDFSQSICNNP